MYLKKLTLLIYAQSYDIFWIDITIHVELNIKVYKILLNEEAEDIIFNTFGRLA